MVSRVALSVAFFMRHHAGALFTGFGFQQSPVDKNVEIMPQEIGENFLRTRFKEDIVCVGGQSRFGFRTRDLHSFDFANRQKLQHCGLSVTGC